MGFCPGRVVVMVCSERVASSIGIHNGWGIIVETRLALHRGIAVGIGTGTTRGVVVAVSVLQTTMRVGVIRGASGGGVSCCALGVDSSVGGA